VVSGHDGAVLLASLPADPARPTGARNFPAVLPESAASQAVDEYAETINRVEVELETALDSLDGWPKTSWRASRTDLPNCGPPGVCRPTGSASLIGCWPLPMSPGSGPGVGRRSARFRQSQQARRENMLRLHAVRRRLHDDLLGT